VLDGPVGGSFGNADGGLGKAVGFQLMACFCAHVLLIPYYFVIGVG
jgi:hypothetical protein